MFFKFPDWMYYYLDYLPACIDGYPINKEKQVKEIERYMNIEIYDAEDEILWYKIHHIIDILTELHIDGELVQPGTEYS